MVIEGQGLLDIANISEEKLQLNELICDLPRVLMGETILKGSLCLSQNLVYKLLQLISKTHKSIQRIEVEIKKDLLVIMLAVKRKNNLYNCLLKIKKIEISKNNDYLLLHFSELPKFKTTNVLQNLFVGFGTMVTSLKSAEEFIIKYLIGNRKGFEVTEQHIAVDIKKIPYLCDIYEKELFGLKFLDVIGFKEIQINEGLLELFWEFTLPSS